MMILQYLLAFWLSALTLHAPPEVVPGTIKEINHETYLDLNQFGLKGDGSDEFALLQKAFQKAADEEMIITGKGIFNFNGKILEVNKPLWIKAINKGDLIFRNGNFIHANSDIILDKVIFRDFKTAAFGYPAGKQPAKKIKIQVTNCDFINNNAAFYCRQESFSTMLTDSKFSGNQFINSNFAAIYLKFNYRDLIIEKNHFEGVANGGKKLVALVLIGADTTGGGEGLKFRNNTVKDIIHPGDDLNYTILAHGDKSLVSGNEFENVSHVAYYARGNNNTIEDNKFFNSKVTSKHAIIAKKASTSGILNIRNNQVSGRFSTGIYIDSRFKTLNIQDNDIQLKDRSDTMNYAAIRILGHEDHDSLNIMGNSINIDVKGKRSVCIRINGKNFRRVNISGNKQLQSNGGILLTGKNSEIKELRMRDNNMKASGPSHISAERIDVTNNEMNFELEGRNGFKVSGNREMKKEKNRVKN